MATVEHHDRLRAVFIVMGVEQMQLLAAVHGVERVVDIEHDAGRHAAEAVAVVVDHGPPHAQQGARVGQVFRPRDGGSRAQIGIVGQALHRKPEQRIAAQRVGIVAVRVSGSDHQHAEAEDLVEPMHDPLRFAWIAQAGGHAPGDTEPPLDLAQQQQPTVG